MLSFHNWHSSKTVSKSMRHLTQPQRSLANLETKNVQKREKSAPLDKCYPISVPTSRFGSSEQTVLQCATDWASALTLDTSQHSSTRNYFSRCWWWLLRKRDDSRYPFRITDYGLTFAAPQQSRDDDCCGERFLDAAWSQSGNQTKEVRYQVDVCWWR